MDPYYADAFVPQLVSTLRTEYRHESELTIGYMDAFIEEEMVRRLRRRSRTGCMCRVRMG